MNEQIKEEILTILAHLKNFLFVTLSVLFLIVTFIPFLKAQLCIIFFLLYNEKNFHVMREGVICIRSGFMSQEIRSPLVGAAFMN